MSSVTSWFYGAKPVQEALKQPVQPVGVVGKTVAKTKEIAVTTASTVGKKASAGIGKAYEYAPPVRQWSASTIQVAKSKPYHAAAVVAGLLATSIGTIYMMGQEPEQTWTNWATMGLL